MVSMQADQGLTFLWDWAEERYGQAQNLNYELGPGLVQNGTQTAQQVAGSQWIVSLSRVMVVE